jgi:hypothetical protein
MKKVCMFCIILLIASFAAGLWAQDEQADPSEKCLACHQKGSPGLYNQWAASKHAANGVGCIECHQAEEADPDAFKHIGVLIATLVTPKDCGQCHEQESEEIGSSYHAAAGEILDSNDAYLAHVAGGSPAAITGCESCHGAVVKLDPESPNKLSSKTWPNSGIGRLNPDGSKGSCAAPTCATCHMSATTKQPVTHDVGKRISWTLRPIISKKKDNWEQKRDNMLNVCTACHGKRFPQNHYYQFDALVELYNEKFARPASEIMTQLRDNQALKNPASFSNKIEWTFWELWHHEGRRARHGASMMGPDYTWWHGIYEVAQHFYFKFLPEALEYGDPDVNAYIDKMLKIDPMHTWLNRPTAELKQEIRSGKIQEAYQELFKKK